MTLNIIVETTTLPTSLGKMILQYAATTLAEFLFKLSQSDADTLQSFCLSVPHIADVESLQSKLTSLCSSVQELVLKYGTYDPIDKLMSTTQQTSGGP